MQITRECIVYIHQADYYNVRMTSDQKRDETSDLLR